MDGALVHGAAGSIAGTLTKSVTGYLADHWVAVVIVIVLVLCLLYPPTALHSRVDARTFEPFTGDWYGNIDGIVKKLTLAYDRDPASSNGDTASYKVPQISRDGAPPVELEHATVFAPLYPQFCAQLYCKTMLDGKLRRVEIFADKSRLYLYVYSGSRDTSTGTCKYTRTDYWRDRREAEAVTD